MVDNNASPIVLITGCSSGIGAACAKHFANKGASVFAGVRSLPLAPDTDLGPNVRVIELDVSCSESVAAAGDRVATEIPGRLDAVINNAGICLPGPLESIPLPEFAEHFDVNVTGPLRVTQTFLPMLARPGGKIIFVGSPLGDAPRPLCGSYAASKAALHVLAETLQMELKPSGYQICHIVPDQTDTPIWAKAREHFKKTGNTSEVFKRDYVNESTRLAQTMEPQPRMAADTVAAKIWELVTADAPPFATRVP